MILAHQGMPVHMCKCSMTYSMSEVGPKPKSNPRSFRYPMCSGIELMSSSERSEILPAGSARFSLVAEASDAADEVELKRADIGPGKEDVAFHARPPASGALLNLPYPPEGRTVNEDICKGSVNIHAQSLEFAERRFIQFIGETNRTTGAWEGSQSLPGDGRNCATPFQAGSSQHCVLRPVFWSLNNRSRERQIPRYLSADIFRFSAGRAERTRYGHRYGPGTHYLQ